MLSACTSIVDGFFCGCSFSIELCVVETIRDLFMVVACEEQFSRVALLLMNIDIDRSDLGEWTMTDYLS